MEFTTSFELQSQTTRLRYTDFKWNTQETDGIVTLSDTLFKGAYSWYSTRHACHNTRRFGNMGSSRFSRPY
eukprot:NODE_4296_length_288_cov_26747.041841_g3625_i0.p3 GENE.NODE_4296_length_288_cov_26747.041841_g3625_i0~~NODE_4296_length_288_cov_26747.041841_g3625_i0.p3  ORF type:complete len:71 (+),score=4.85 NODE_4296_length_288_cov_26747.041841_g3625_i0:52-264(+)